MAQLSSGPSDSVLADSVTYPYLSRLLDSYEKRVEALFAVIEYYSKLSSGGPIGWSEVGLICTADKTGLQITEKFASVAPSRGIKVVSNQQYLPTATDVSTEVRQLKNSGARVFVAPAFLGWSILAREAKKQGIIGENYVWLVGDGVTSLTFYLGADGVTLIPDAIENTKIGKGKSGTENSIIPFIYQRIHSKFHLHY